MGEASGTALVRRPQRHRLSGKLWHSRRPKEGSPMFEYFPNNYTWSLAVMGAINRGGQISEIDEACRPLKELAAVKALGGDQTAQRAWVESWMKLAERVERLGAADEDAGRTLSAGRKY